MEKGIQRKNKTKRVGMTDAGAFVLFLTGEDSIPVRISRRRVKNINMYLRPPYTEVLVTAPRQMAESRITDFVRDKQPWIMKNLVKLRARKQSNPLEQPMTDAEKRKLAGRLNSILPEMVSRWEARLHVKAESFRLRVMRRCWGVCHTKARTITFNTHLGAKPESCIEYVVVHELCHLLEPSHNARFHRLMDSFLPDWKSRKKELNAC